MIQVRQRFLSLENIVVALWILNLFKPDWVLSYATGIPLFRAIPTILLYPAMFCLFISHHKVILDRPYLTFALASLVSTIIAYNSGLSRLIFRAIFESLMLYILTISLLKEEKYIDRLFKLYLLSFVYYSLWGIPNGGRVPWHVHMSDEDAFGPFMAMGVPMAFYMAHRSGAINYKEMSVSILCILGVVASFARGAFLSLCAGVVYIWYRYHRKFLAFLTVMIISVLVLAAAAVMFQDSYWEEMSTILDSHKDEVGVGDTGRQFLWKNAWKMFLDHPLFGIGLSNYGFLLPRYATLDEMARLNISHSETYGRQPHNIYLQMLAEMGIAGIMTYLVLIATFIYQSNSIRKKYLDTKKQNDIKYRENTKDGAARIIKYYHLTLALQGALFVYLVNGVVYNLMYIHWFSDLLIINTLLYNETSNKESLQ